MDVSDHVGLIENPGDVVISLLREVKWQNVDVNIFVSKKEKKAGKFIAKMAAFPDVLSSYENELVNEQEMVLLSDLQQSKKVSYFPS